MYYRGNTLVTSFSKSWGTNRFMSYYKNFLRSQGKSLLQFEKQSSVKSPTFNQQKSDFQTSAVKEDSCMPTQLPPKCGPQNCAIPRPNIWKDCKTRRRPQWKGCDKICMPCCCPAWSPPDCDQLELRMNTCKRVEYRIPSYSECRKYPMKKKTKKECCYSELPCPELGIDDIGEPLISTKVRQETILGRRKGVRGQARQFSTAAAILTKDSSNDCNKSGQLPCLKPSNVTSTTKTKTARSTCNKLCMPCCPPARDPPECIYPFEKTECNRPKPPRPSFSECNKEKKSNIPECECHEPPVPPCNTIHNALKRSC